MKKSLEEDLSDLSAILESVVKNLPKTVDKDLIDLTARLKPLAKHMEAIDKYCKDIVKGKLNNKEGSVPGNIFKAVLKLVPVTRLDQKALKEEKPKLYAEYCREDEDKRVTFEVR